MSRPRVYLRHRSECLGQMKGFGLNSFYHEGPPLRSGLYLKLPVPFTQYQLELFPF